MDLNIFYCASEQRENHPGSKAMRIILEIVCDELQVESAPRMSSKPFEQRIFNPLLSPSDLIAEYAVLKPR